MEAKKQKFSEVKVKVMEGCDLITEKSRMQVWHLEMAAYRKAHCKMVYE